jgi:hypothetical protein
MKKFKLSQKIILWLIILSLTVAQAVQPAYAAFAEITKTIRFVSSVLNAVRRIIGNTGHQ